MTRALSRSILILVVSLSLSSLPSTARADATREFILSCTYGALAGSIVGAATLAFSDKPGDNLNKVARGASLGLYAGILLGLYVVYGGPSEDDDVNVNVGESLNKKSYASRDTHFKLLEPPRFQAAPIIGDKGVEGGFAQATVVRF
jgi:hypothetical protein